jgi:hypothetical protein
MTIASAPTLVTFTGVLAMFTQPGTASLTLTIHEMMNSASADLGEEPA